MPKYLLLLILFLACTKSLHSQKTDSLKYKYTNFTIYRYGNTYLKGNERLTFKELSREFSMSDLGFDSYMKAKKFKTISTVMRWASFLAGLSSLAVIANNGNTNTAVVLLGGQVALGYSASKYGHMSAQNLDRALWQRNKDLLFPNTQ
jgi:hypothetical protein